MGSPFSAASSVVPEMLHNRNRALALQSNSFFHYFKDDQGEFQVNRIALRIAFLLLAACGLLSISILQAQNAAAPAAAVQAVKAEAAPGATAPCPTPKTEEISAWQKEQNERLLKDFPGWRASRRLI